MLSPTKAAFFLAPTIAFAATFVSVPLESPLDWVAGPLLFPAHVIAGFNADLDEYDAGTWGAHVLTACEDLEACTSALAFQAQNSGDTGGRYWFGYAYSGGPTDESYYKRADSTLEVTDSAAWTIVE